MRDYIVDEKEESKFLYSVYTDIDSQDISTDTLNIPLNSNRTPENTERSWIPNKIGRENPIFNKSKIVVSEAPSSTKSSNQRYFKKGFYDDIVGPPKPSKTSKLIKKQLNRSKLNTSRSQSNLSNQKSLSSLKVLSSNPNHWKYKKLYESKRVNVHTSIKYMGMRLNTYSKPYIFGNKDRIPTEESKILTYETKEQMERQNILASLPSNRYKRFHYKTVPTNARLNSQNTDPDFIQKLFNDKMNTESSSQAFNKDDGKMGQFNVKEVYKSARVLKKKKKKQIDNILDSNFEEMLKKSEEHPILNKRRGSNFLFLETGAIKSEDRKSRFGKAH